MAATGVKVISPTDARSEGFSVTRTAICHNQKNVILRGNGGRELLADVLRNWARKFLMLNVIVVTICIQMAPFITGMAGSRCRQCYYQQQ